MNDKVKKKLDRILTVVSVVSVIICLSLCIQVIQGKDAGLFGFRIFHILTGSMEPTIPTGSNVISKTVDTDSLEVGDIITFISRDQAIYGNANTHRIVAVVVDENGERCFATRGDANNATDSLLVYPEDVLGKVVFHMSPSISLFLGFLHTKFGFVTVILLPLLLIIFLLTRDFKNGVQEYLGDGDKDSVVGNTTEQVTVAGAKDNFVEQGKTSEVGNTTEQVTSPIEMSDDAFNLWMAQHPEMMMNPEYFTRWVSLNPELVNQWMLQNQQITAAETKTVSEAVNITDEQDKMFSDAIKEINNK